MDIEVLLKHLHSYDSMVNKSKGRLSYPACSVQELMAWADEQVKQLNK